MPRDAADLYAQIEQRRAELGLSQAQLSMLAFGKNDTSAVQNIKRGSSPSFERLGAIADALGLELYFGRPRDTGLIEHVMIDGSDYAHIPLHDAELAAGDGADNACEHVVDHLAFRRDWLQREGITPSNACLARVRGDSMMPTISPGDVVLIDTSKREPPLRSPINAGVRHRAPIFALRGADGAQVKRLLRPAPDQLMIISDNPDYLPQLGKLTERAETEIIGKVVWWGHTAKE